MVDNKESVVQYETAIEANKFVVVVHGTGAEVAKAREILAKPELQRQSQ